MPWLTLLAASLVIALTTLIPGLAAGLLLGLRGLALWAVAAPIGLSIVAVASVVLPFLHIAWSLWAVLGFAVVCLAAVALLRITMRRSVRPPRSKPSSSPWWTVGSLAAAAVVIALQLAVSLGSADAISQTFDNVFHLNAIRYIIDSGNASPLWIGTMTSQSDSPSFYPDAWHALGALAVAATGVSIPIVANAISLVFAAIVWPAGAMLLARTLFGGRRAITVGAALVLCGLPAFPLLMITYGVLYPFFMGLAVLPVSVVAAVSVLRLDRGGIDDPHWVWIVVVIGCLPGLTLAHPGAFMAWLAIVAVAAVVAAIFYFASRPPRYKVVVASLALALFAGLASLALWVLRPPDAARTWPTIMTIGQATGEVMTASMYSAPVSIVAVFLIVGLISSIRLRTRSGVFAAASFAVVGLLYIVCAALPYWRLRDLLVGPWYDNSPRLAAILPVTIVPLAALGIAKAWDFTMRLLARRRGRAGGRSVSPLLRALVAAAGVIVIFGWTQWAMRAPIAAARYTYTYSPSSPLLSADELALIERIDKETPPGAVIAGSPWTGTSLAFALTDRRVLMPHILMDTNRDIDLINLRLRYASSGSAVCRAIEREHVTYVLDFGTHEVHGDHHDFRGVSELKGSSAVRLVDSQGGARLYQVIGCGEGS